MDALPDGRLVTIVGASIYTENAPHSRSFNLSGSLPNADIASFGAAFLRVSPNGTKIAVGNNGGSSFSDFKVGVFDVSSLTGVWFNASHFDASWVDSTHLAITGGDFGSPSKVSILDITSANLTNPENRTVISNIGGASAGVAFDGLGNLYTGNGFANTGPSGTGAVKAFSQAAWSAAYMSGTPIDFEASGTLIIDILSASPLVFDEDGNLFIGGGDFGSQGDVNFAALARSSAVVAALDGSGAIDPSSTTMIRRLDPDTISSSNYYAVTVGAVLHEAYVRDAGGPTVFVYAYMSAENPFAGEVLEFAPAPGQFVNVSKFNDPTKALGPPSGGGVEQPNNASVVTLGGFGGYIVLAFDHPVKDDPLNPFGLDAIVFGNAHWVGGDPQRHWAECATIEISVDENHNGLADDAWYLIPGSHIPIGPTERTSVTWDSLVDENTYPPGDADWIPSGESGQWTTEAFGLPNAVFARIPIINPASSSYAEGIWGYADYSPTLLLGDMDANDIIDDPAMTPEEFYTRPDDPFTVGMSAGSGGGDAFDIAWAINPGTGAPANLRSFDFIRITTAVSYVSPLFGELSAEIDAVADVSPEPFGDFDGDGDIDLSDVAAVQNCRTDGSQAVCRQFERPAGEEWDLIDCIAVIERLTGPMVQKP